MYFFSHTFYDIKHYENNIKDFPANDFIVLWNKKRAAVTRL